MPRVYFSKDFDYYPHWPSRNVLIAYRAGSDHVVKQACADAAITSGAAIKPPTQRRRKAAEE